MLRRLSSVLLVVALLLAFAVPVAFGIDPYPDPRPVTPEEVDPDGLEGVSAGPGHQAEEAFTAGGSQASTLIRSFFRMVRLIGL
ncbi:MAG: hypothetical protein ABIH26_07525 [Candidatus Eisenbacteria bacterium]